MRILITVGSRRGGTEGLACMLADDLRAEGIDAEVVVPGKVGALDRYDVVIVGGALYANRWHRAARRFVRSHADQLRERPAYFFSSGPLDNSATEAEIPPVRQVRALMDRVGARDHATFGGRLSPEARGFPASVMAKKMAGDYRDATQVRAWAHAIATTLRVA
jgi:menaquinone-dependent protoporphyrinogen oxidase